ncbi:hypothetical protein [Neptunicella sp.]|uniref:hypothetical protein n=1 Tax=Neptunicella sp. TaxID=2125986 RepID=UPI003F68C5B2
MNKFALKTIVTAFISLSLIGCQSTAPRTYNEIASNIYEKDKPEMIEAKKLGAPILMTSLWSNKPNSAGGVTVRGFYYALADSDNPIKYIDFEVIPYNAVNDVVASTIDGKTKASLRVTGPLVEKQGENIPVIWENVWYNNSLSCVQLNSITFEYINGDKKTYSEDFDDIMSDQLTNGKPCGGLPRNKSPQL